MYGVIFRKEYKTIKTKQTTLAKEFLKGTVQGFFFGSGIMFWTGIALGLIADKLKKDEPEDDLDFLN